MLDILPTRKRAAEVAGKNQDTITAWSRGEGLGQFQALASVAAEAGVSLDWLAFRRRQVPVLGLAECGLAGWYQETALGLSAEAPPAVQGDPGAVAVLAVGDSMVPAGIKPGDLVFCQPGTPATGDSVLVEQADGMVSIKRWGGRSGDWVTLQGWLPPEGGVQMPYEDARRADQLGRILVVTAVRPGIAPVAQAAPAQPAPSSAEAERLYRVAISTTLQWLDDADLELAPPNVTGLITTAVGALQQAASADKTDKELEVEVRRTLDVAKGMLTALGWKPL